MDYNIILFYEYTAEWLEMKIKRSWINHVKCLKIIVMKSPRGKDEIENFEKCFAFLETEWTRDPTSFPSEWILDLASHFIKTKKSEIWFARFQSFVKQHREWFTRVSSIKIEDNMM